MTSKNKTMKNWYKAVQSAAIMINCDLIGAITYAFICPATKHTMSAAAVRALIHAIELRAGIVGVYACSFTQSEVRKAVTERDTSFIIRIVGVGYFDHNSRSNRPVVRTGAVDMRQLTEGEYDDAIGEVNKYGKEFILSLFEQILQYANNHPKRTGSNPIAAGMAWNKHWARIIATAQGKGKKKKNGVA